jgi:hypothetical protein
MMKPCDTQAHLQDQSQAREISRLLTAAVINPEFRHLLLTNSPSALKGGYNGESFNFSADSQNLILSIQAASLEDFASQLVVLRSNGNGNGNGANGNGRHPKVPAGAVFHPSLPFR